MAQILLRHRKGVRISGEGLDALAELYQSISELTSPDVYLADKRIEKIVRPVIIAAHEQGLSTPSELVPAAEQILQGLEAPPRIWQVLVPISNFELPSELRRVRLGSMRLVRFGPREKNRVYQKSQHVISRSSSDDRQKSEAEKAIATLLESSDGVCVAVTVSSPDESSAEDIAMERALRVCDLLQTLTPFKYPPSHNAYVAVQGDLYRATRLMVALSDGKFSYRIDSTGAKLRVSFSKEEISQSVQDFGPVIDAIGTLPRRRTDMQWRLLDALEYAASAVREERRRNKVVKYFAAWERVLNPSQSGGGPTHAIAELSAFVLSDDVGERTEIYETVKAVYGRCRSAVLHGRTSSVSADDVDYVHAQVMSLIAQVGKHAQEWHTVGQLHEWATSQRFGGAITPG